MADVVIELIPGKIVFVRKTTGRRKSISCVAATVKGTWICPGPICTQAACVPKEYAWPSDARRSNPSGARPLWASRLPSSRHRAVGRKAVARKNSRWSRFLSCFAERALLHLGFDDQEGPVPP